LNGYVTTSGTTVKCMSLKNGQRSDIASECGIGLSAESRFIAID
jgi:hypothetical protein